MAVKQLTLEVFHAFPIGSTRVRVVTSTHKHRVVFALRHCPFAFHLDQPFSGYSGVGHNRNDTVAELDVWAKFEEVGIRFEVLLHL